MKEINGSVGLGGSPGVSTLLSMTSTTKGLLPPRGTSAQEAAISSPTTGLIFYNTTTNTLDYYTGTQWIPISSSELRGVVAAGDVTTTSNSLGSVTGLSFSIGATETWTFEFFLGVSSGSGGIGVGINGPVAATVVATVMGVSTGATARTADQITALATSTTSVFASSISTPLHLQIFGEMTSSSTTGTCQLQFKSLTNGQTSTIWANSFFCARRIA